MIPDYRKLARTLTIVENNLPGSTETLKNLNTANAAPVIGITGPPGAGKSTLINALINTFSPDRHIAVVAVDPTSPFNQGSLLGDRIRMRDQFNKDHVFIRSVAARGVLGGLSAKTIEMVDVIKGSGFFDYIFIETVGVGQSEIDIARLADITLLVLVPESGDEIQIFKSGLMEAADVFVVNKSDRPGSDIFAATIKKFIRDSGKHTPVFNITASTGEGVDKLISYVRKNSHHNKNKEGLLADKAWELIQERRMSDIDKREIKKELAKAMQAGDLNLYRFIEKYL